MFRELCQEGLGLWRTEQGFPFLLLLKLCNFLIKRCNQSIRFCRRETLSNLPYMKNELLHRFGHTLFSLPGMSLLYLLHYASCVRNPGVPAFSSSVVVVVSQPGLVYVSG